MEGEKPLLSQKEYLKRYLSKDKTKKKKKKTKISSSSHIKRSVIIDDDLGLKDVATIDDEEFNLDYLGDEAPQIVGIIDERPNELKAKEKYTNNLWRSVGKENDNDKTAGKEAELIRSSIVKSKNDSDSDLSPPRPDQRNTDKKERVGDIEIKKYEKYNSLKKKNNRKSESSDSDLSPARKYGKEVHSGRNRRNKRNESFDSDLSPDRKHNEKENNSDSDLTPPRKRDKYISQKENEMNELKNRKKIKSTNDSVLFKEYVDKSYKYKSKDRKNDESDSDVSISKNYKPKNRDKYKSNEEREYRNKHEVNKAHRSSYSNHDYANYKRYRHLDEKEDNHRRGASSSHNGKKYKNVPVLDSRIDERKARTLSRDGNKNKEDYDSDLSPPRSSSQLREKKDKLNTRGENKERMLDGKKSGLQDAKNLKEELKRLKQNEDKMFKKMDPSLLGANAAPIQRNRKTGQVRQFEKEAEEEREKVEKRKQLENKYYKWGKGLKQMQEQEDRIADAIHEMSKPLARYRDDKDLDAYLRAQEREGDPMLEYIRSKQTESHNVIDLTATGNAKPKYNGSFMPNRFGIPPGYRWDGVDRSNGYEKKWFEQRNARKAVEEQAYKWSTSDM